MVYPAHLGIKRLQRKNAASGWMLVRGWVYMSDRKTDSDPQRQGAGGESWVDFRRKVSDVPQDKRRHPRLEFHCPARIHGAKGVYRVTDISMGGVFVELGSPSAFEVGQALNLTMKLPTEHEPTKVAVEVANIRTRGIGLRFTDMTRKNQEAIRFCFETFKDTVPLR